MRLGLDLETYERLRPLLFTLDPETAHKLVYGGMAAASTFAPALARLQQRYGWSDPVLAQDLWGLHFDGAIGLAAGFDKDARAVPALAAMGFNFIEVGTLTPRPQPGNPRPRLFRLPADQALINRMGFNNEGAAAAARRLGRLRQRTVPVGVNLGKNKLTPLDLASDDYLEGMAEVYAVADYLVVNVSSPNTPGLRDLQSGEALGALLRKLTAYGRELAVQRGVTPRPLLVKLAPDLTPAELEEAVGTVLEAGMDGIIATNTTTSRQGLLTADPPALGGLSGKPLKERANHFVTAIRRLAGPRLPIIGVGGIFSGQDAYERIRAGANLVQAYTGFVYRGPSFASDAARELGLLLRRDGFSHIGEAVGVDVPPRT